MVSQFRENEEDELQGEVDSPGPGAYLDIYKNSAFKAKKGDDNLYSKAPARFAQSNTLTAGPGSYES